MMRKRALIVDDSKTARQVLAKKLAAYQIDVETADSAATAIDYLYGNTPDAVFMDYEMPGMDGFQALKIIKSNPKTATIPVMMYTSKEGGIALSQARALGAIGVLPKKMEAEGLDAIIEQLHLHPHQHSLVQRYQDEYAPSRAKGSFASEADASSNVEYLKVPQEGNEKVEYPEEIYDESVFLLKRHAKIIQKELASVERRFAQFLTREIGELKAVVNGSLVTQSRDTGRHKDSRGPLYLFGISLLCLLGYLIVQQAALRNQLTDSGGLTQLHTGLSQLNDQVKQLAASGVPQPLVNQKQGVGEEQTETQPNMAFLHWAANRGTEFEYGENPYNDLSIAWLSELIGQLNKVGFRGIVNLKAHYGNFCLTKSETGSLVLAADEMPFEECLFSADSKDTGFAQSSYQTLGFANYLNSLVSDKDIPIEVVIDSDDYEDPTQPYPDRNTVKVAKTWNKIAALNQRIEVILYPTGP